MKTLTLLLVTLSVAILAACGSLADQRDTREPGSGEQPEKNDAVIQGPANTSGTGVTPTPVPTTTPPLAATPFPTATPAPPAPTQSDPVAATADVAARPDVVSVAIGRVSGEPEETTVEGDKPYASYKLWPVQVERYVLSPLLYGRLTILVPDLDSEEYEATWSGGPGLPSLEPDARYVFFLTEIPEGEVGYQEPAFAVPWSPGLSIGQGIVAIEGQDTHACRDDGTCGYQPLEDFLRDVTRAGMRTARHSRGGPSPAATPEKSLVNEVPVNCAAPQQDDSIKPPPCGPGAEVGEAYAFRLYVHCGPQIAYFDGRRWSADLSPSERGAGSPPGWSDPEEAGVMELVTEDRLRFTAGNGVSVDFVPADREEYEAFACM
ncbi:MAG: hypothetical protein ACOC5K_01780 [Chloroflexota bacterium]